MIVCLRSFAVLRMTPLRDGTAEAVGNAACVILNEVKNLLPEILAVFRMTPLRDDTAEAVGNAACVILNEVKNL